MHCGPSCTKKKAQYFVKFFFTVDFFDIALGDAVWSLTNDINPLLEVIKIRTWVKFKLDNVKNLVEIFSSMSYFNLDERICSSIISDNAKEKDFLSDL